MSYQLKSVRYLNEPRKILLQNINGPCPLLAAANALLLRGIIHLPARSITSGVASIDDVVNMLAERALKQSGSDLVSDRTSKKSLEHDSSREYQIDELLSLFPSLQFGMDVNPTLVSVTGVEYTKNLTAFDLMGVELVHGWLVDPNDKDTASIIGNKTYNELIEMVITSSEAHSSMEMLEALINESGARLEVHKNKIPLGDTECDVVQDKEWINVVSSEIDLVEKSDIKSSDDVEEKNGSLSEKKDFEQRLRAKEAVAEFPPPSCNKTPATDFKTQLKSLISELDELQKQYNKQSLRYRNSSIVESFLTETSHQLTFTGLTELHNYLQENRVCVFFRNNHFSTMTKFAGTLYLLVTDLGYANVSDVVWEKLDDVSGDTEYVNDLFVFVEPRDQSAVDYQLAIELSKTGDIAVGAEEQLVAAATKASIYEWNNHAQGEGMNQRATIEGLEEGDNGEKKIASINLARQLQGEENSHVSHSSRQKKVKSGCIIS